jgi:hypothetical protein
MNDRDIMQQVLSAVEWIAKQRTGGMIQRKATEVITALRERLAQPEQEPVAIALNTGTKQGVKWLKNVEHGENLYTTPPAAQPAQHPVAFVNADHLQGLTLGHYGYAEIYTDESQGRVPLYTTAPAAPMTEFEEAVAACDNTLHYAIDYWQDRAMKAEALLTQPELTNQCGETCERAKLCATCGGMLSQPEKQAVAIDWDTKTDTPIMGYTAPPAALTQEPVAWMYQCTADNSRPVLLHQKQNWAESGTGLWVESPLYTTAPAAVQEPVAYEYGDELYWHTNPALNDYIRDNGKALVYATTPAAAQRTWVGLTDEEEDAASLRPSHRSQTQGAKQMTNKLNKMWAALAAYQPQADAAGHGKSWARMCSERTAASADAAADAAATAYDDAADAAYAAAYAAYAANAAAAEWSCKAIDRINKVLKIQPAPAAPVQEPRGYQWLDTSVFRKKLPENAEPDAWNALYTTPPAAQPERDLIRRMQGQIERLQAALHTLPDRGLSAMVAGQLQAAPTNKQ